MDDKQLFNIAGNLDNIYKIVQTNKLFIYQIFVIMSFKRGLLASNA